MRSLSQRYFIIQLDKQRRQYETMIQSLTDGDAKTLKALEDQLKGDRDKYMKELQQLRSEIANVMHLIRKKNPTLLKFLI